MRDSEEFYLEKMYPLQNGVLSTLETIHSPFYLTGGTALGREYTRHRYSDDLDFFLNGEPEYKRHVEEAFIALRGAEVFLQAVVSGQESIFEEDYSRFFDRK